MHEYVTYFNTCSKVLNELFNTYNFVKAIFLTYKTITALLRIPYLIDFRLNPLCGQYRGLYLFHNML